MKRIFFTIILIGIALSGNAQRKVTLDECLGMARDNNITLKNAALSILAAREQKSEVYTKYYPQIQANVMAMHTFGAFMQGGDAIRTYTAAISAVVCRRTDYDRQQTGGTEYRRSCFTKGHPGK